MMPYTESRKTNFIGKRNTETALLALDADCHSLHGEPASNQDIAALAWTILFLDLHTASSDLKTILTSFYRQGVAFGLRQIAPDRRVLATASLGTFTA